VLNILAHKDINSPAFFESSLKEPSIYPVELLIYVVISIKKATPKVALHIF